MAEEKSARIPAMQALDTINDRLSAEIPGYAESLERERNVEARCQAVRTQLRTLRARENKRQAEIARKMGVGQSAVSKIESGYGDLSLQTVFRYLDALGVEANIHVGGPTRTYVDASVISPADVSSIFEGTILEGRPVRIHEARKKLIEAAVELGLTTTPAKE
jgi:transcriptional regulator with XRE-family HTH domain